MAYKVFFAILACCALHAQPAKFEVASIKPGTPGGQNCGVKFSPLQFTLSNCPLEQLVRYAFSLQKFEFAPGPELLKSVYDITAKSAKPADPRQQYRMLQSLLEDRFRLKWHREKRDLPVYYLSAAKGGVKLSPTVAGSCVPFDHKSPPPPPLPGAPTSCDFILMPGTPDGLGLGMEGKGVPMNSLVAQLTGLLGRPVIDKTGFTGIFDLHLKFARDSSLAVGGHPDEPGQAPNPAGLPNIFTAIRSLGLNIESGKGPVDAFVVDSVQRPSAN